MKRMILNTEQILLEQRSEGSQKLRKCEQLTRGPHRMNRIFAT
jgi:hypothetical protein